MRKDEAEKLVCPFIQMGELDGWNRSSAPRNIKCITDECMAWVKHEFGEELEAERKWDAKEDELFVRYDKESGNMIYKKRLVDEGHCVRLNR